MSGRRKKQNSDTTKPSVGRGLARPYGLAATAVVSVEEPKEKDRPIELRCPSCGRRIHVWWKWWDTLKSWYRDSYRLVQCRRCGTRFAARRQYKSQVK